MDPVASRPGVPEDYGVPAHAEELLPWAYVVERLTESKRYWLSTVTPDGAPHTRPVDGFWLDDRLYFDGSPGSRWRRNLQEDPRACLNLEDGEHAVILHGAVSTVRLDRSLAVRLIGICNEKYGLEQSLEEWEGQESLVFEPSVAFAWRVFYEDATRWRFRPEG